jgi:hypothetical protein
MTMANILRQGAARQKVAVGKTKFSDDYVLRDDSDPYVPGTDGQVRRVRSVALGERSIGFIEDEIDALIEALRHWRNGTPPQPRKQPEQLRTGRDEWRERVNKRRVATKTTEIEQAEPT